MILDLRVGKERKQFATQAGNIPAEIKMQLDEDFVGDETTDFYEGLLAGYVCSYQINKSPDAQRILGGIVAYLSEILEERSVKTT